MANLDDLMDVPFLLQCYLGRSYITVKQFLELSPDSVLKLDNILGGNVIIKCEGKELITGEIGVDNDKFNIRVLDVANYKKE